MYFSRYHKVCMQKRTLLPVSLPFVRVEVGDTNSKTLVHWLSHLETREKKSCIWNKTLRTGVIKLDADRMPKA